MGRKSVAVLDVRSSEVAIVIGERGVNNTFVFKASKTEDYYGYHEGKFHDVNGLVDAIYRAISSVEHMCGERIKEIYIGVPGEFCIVEPREQTISFPRKRRIGQREIDALFASGNEEREGYKFLRATSMIFTTADNRRVVDPSGLSSSMLSGVLSYFYCSEYFVSVMEKAFERMGITLHYLPTQYAMGVYLIPSETRDEYALLLDVGFLSSTVLLLLGNGVLAQYTCDEGKVQIAVRIMKKLGLPYDVAMALLSKANLYAKLYGEKVEFLFQGTPYEIETDKLVETVKEGLDDLCEEVSKFLEDYSSKELDAKPLYVTGEGIYEIRGALEHVSKRLSRVCESVAPDLPYYNKPSMSSRIALVDMAYEDNRNRGILNRLLNGFGG